MKIFVGCNIIVHSRIDLLKIIYNLIFKNKILIENNIIILFRTGPFKGTIGFTNEDDLLGATLSFILE